jgi:2-desacetyl-2-hydroxyethyl bacteriochlorophyllide A dehydrogenase
MPAEKAKVFCRARNFGLNRRVRTTTLARTIPVLPMKAAIYIGPGRFELVEKPAPKPAPGECLLETSRAGVCGTDVRIFRGHLQNRVGAKRILGHEAVAIVRETSAAGKFRAGDRVVVEPTIFCSDCAACRRGFTHVCQNLRILGIDQDGAFQQFWTVPENRLHLLPATISDDHAAMIEPLAVAVHSVRCAALRAGETVAVIGAGTIGSLIAILAAKAGAKVAVLEINPFRLEFARRFGLQTFNPQEQDFAQILSDFTGGAGMNAVFEASGSSGGARAMTALAAVRGRTILVGIHDRDASLDLYQIFARELSLQGVRAYASGDFAEAIRLLAAGEINLAPFISKHYPLEQLQQALEFAASDAPAMKILIHFHPAQV